MSTLIHKPVSSMIKENYLLYFSVYFSIPLLMILFLLRTELDIPQKLSDWKIYYYIFGLPHVIFSLPVFWEKINKGMVKTVIFPGKLLIYYLVPIVLFFLSDKLLIFYYLWITLRHVAFQQLGISRSLLKSAPRLFSGFTYLILIPIFIPYLVSELIQDFGVSDNWVIFFNHYLDYQKSFYALSLILFGYLLLNFKLIFSKENSWQGKIYYLATLLSFLFFGFMFSKKYFLLGVLAPRLAHDMTAFITYIKFGYDKNKYIKILGSTLLCFTLTYFLIEYGMELTIILVSVTHYYFESFIWRNQSK
jgi:hypothetical protein